MDPYIQIGELTLTTYGLMIAVGIIVSVLYLEIESRHASLSTKETGTAQLALIAASAGTVVGAKLLYLLISADEIAEALELYSVRIVVVAYLSGGFVFYGGLIGAIAGAWIYARFSGTSFGWICRLLVPIIPLFHGFGRIGCFLEGCCYGIESERFGIVFTDSPVAPNGVPLIPVQLYEAAAEFIIFAVLCRRRHYTDGIGLLTDFIFFYAPMRFVLEFLRGDEYRGIFFGISFSQIISLAMIIWAVWLRRRNIWRRRQTRTAAEKEYEKEKMAESQSAV